MSLLEVGRVVKPHGLRGEVIVDLISNRPEERLARGAVLQSERGPLEVVSASAHQHRWIVAFEGVADRNGAEELRDLVLRAEPIEGEEDTLWVHELVGSLVYDTLGRCYGPVEVVEAGSPEERRHLAFRDRLRADAGVRDRYVVLKHELAARHGSDVDAYADAKTEFIRAHS